MHELTLRCGFLLGFRFTIALVCLSEDINLEMDPLNLFSTEEANRYRIVAQELANLKERGDAAASNNDIKELRNVEILEDPLTKEKTVMDAKLIALNKIAKHPKVRWHARIQA